MNRRAFVGASLTAAAAGLPPAAAASPAAERELYELRTYALKAAKQPVLEQYLEKAFIPAVKRLGAGPVGAFAEKAAGDTVRVVVLVVHPTAESLVTLPARLAADDAHREAAGDYLAARSNDPVYLRIESSVLAAFAGMPKLEKPDPAKPRVFNLRTYESHNERAAAKKVEMFNKGEIAIFRRVGLTPVFFGQAVAGAALANLTYLLVYPDEAAGKAAWGKFGADPEWQKLRAVPEYADREIVSRITNRMLTPLACSEL